MQLVKLAARNLWRNKRRSLITAVAISFGLAMLVFASGFGDGAHGQMIEAGVRSMAGHVVVQGKGWQTKRESSIVVPGSPGVMALLHEKLPDATLLERVYLQGLLTSSSGSVGVALSAVDPVPEASIDDLDDKIIEGRYLGEKANDIVLGSTLARTLHVGLGDKVVLMAQQGGEIQDQMFRVCGIFQYGIEEIDGFTGQIPLPIAQSMLGLGSDVTQISVHIDSYRDTRRAKRIVAAALADRNDVEVLAWNEALPDLYEWVLMDEGGMYVMLLVVAIVVAIGILNTVLMSVLERLREFGVMLALGMKPARLAALVLTEATLLGLVSVAVGVVLGIVCNGLLSINGLDLSAMAGADSMEAAGVSFDMHVFPDLSPDKVAVYAVLAFAMTVGAALYPAYKTATLKPIECLQHR